MSLHLIDLIIIVVYFVLLIAIGLRIARKDNNSESFLAASRNMNVVQTSASAAATDLGGGFSIAMGGLGFTLGISGSWLIAMSGLSIVLVSFLMVPKVKRWADRTQGLTTGDLFEARFDRRTGLVAAIAIGLAWFTFVGGQVIAGAKLLQVLMSIELAYAVLISGVIVLAYTTLGGLKAVIYTDVFQMVILLVGIVFIAVPIGLYQVGGWEGMVAHFSQSPDPEQQRKIQWGAAGWKTILGWFLAVVPVWFVSIAGIQRIVAARDETTARRGFFFAGVPIEWPLFAIGATLVGMIASMLFPDLADPEQATIKVILELLPIGLAGVVVAAYVAAVMSTADSCLIGPVAIFTNDIYRKWLKPQASDKDLLAMARAATLILGVLSIAMAYLIPSVLDLIMYAYTFGAAGLFFPMLALLFWPRATASGAFWSIIAGGAAAVIWSIAGEPKGFSASYMSVMVGLPVLVVVSLSTEHSATERLDLFAPSKP
ncbi:MAG: sodium:solute symporter family protein [Pseudomonadota bacterium]